MTGDVEKLMSLFDKITQGSDASWKAGVSLQQDFCDPQSEWCLLCFELLGFIILDWGNKGQVNRKYHETLRLSVFRSLAVIVYILISSWMWKLGLQMRTKIPCNAE